MINQTLKNLANIYGIEISFVEPGKGGLFYTSPDGKTNKCNDLFLSDHFNIIQRETIPIIDCNQYTFYNEIISLIDAA